MKKQLSKYLILFASISLLLSCNDTQDELEIEEGITEHKYLRILISDELTTELSLVNPFLDEVETFNAKFAKSALYTTESGRFAALIHRDNNFTETFDSGYEFHGDHVDVRGTPKFGALVGNSLAPTHFKSKKGELMTFNDGDGTLSIGKESDIHTPGAELKTIDAGILKHHGAMATFNNGNYAITEKDNTIPGALPERVKIIDANGNTMHASTIATTGIHGNATDGTFAVFGSKEGILVVESNGNQKLISLPLGFDTAWFGTIRETAVNGKFIGYTRLKGAFLIDVEEEKVTPIYESTDIMHCVTSFNNNKLGVLLNSGTLKVIDLFSLSVVKEVQAIDSDFEPTQKPQIILSERFAYITSPKTGELVQVNLQATGIKKIKVTQTPYRLTFIGHENSIDH
ncbi:hypothetical protein [uncultured Polaribacter sp.]|uniref:hypothetical protein n=1 Tax=uncultured Polaribacter sp. TaxID=174711 RepID=UPI002633E1F7|nr:hypothetical protein [uncultured Polaribacter sp.]